MGDCLIEVRNLRTSFAGSRERVVAISDVTFSMQPSETLALVGESGCGKSVTALSILRLLDEPQARIDEGEVLFEDKNLLQLTERQMQDVRGRQIGMVFQEPMTSLNPVFTIGYQLTEAISMHRHLSLSDARARARELLTLVQVPAPDSRLDEYPHQLSGGMRQRVMIAMALSSEPKLLIADEPTTALDVTVQAQVLALLSSLQQRLGMGILLITHDLGIVAEFANRVIVMYAGVIVEVSPVTALFASPLHPYTLGLLGSLPAHVLARSRGTPPTRLPVIEGVVPSLDNLPAGCRFHARCSRRKQFGPDAARCETEAPQLRPQGSERAVRCHFPLTECKA